MNAPVPTQPGEEYYTHVRSQILDLLEPSSRFDEALEIGCASGATLHALLRTNRVRRAVGVEAFPAAASVARERLTDVVEMDAEQWLAQPTLTIHPDLVIVADVLEHLVDPWVALQRLRAMQPVGGTLLLSMPNVQHWTVTVPLLVRGRWRYTESGLLDHTHLRFFTREGILGLLRGANYAPEVSSVSTGPTGRLAIRLSAGLLRPWFAYQYLFRCRAV